MTIIMVSMPYNFIIITSICAKNILAKVSRVLSLDNLVFSSDINCFDVYHVGVGAEKPHLPGALKWYSEVKI